jgi:hypothetical protein
LYRQAVFVIFAPMKKALHLLLILSIPCSFGLFAQTSNPVFFKGAIKEKKIGLQRNIVQNTILKNLSLPLIPDNEENWIDAFGGMELLRYHSPWADGRIYVAFDSIEKLSTGFQRALLELAYANYPGLFIKEVSSLVNTTDNAKIFAMGAEYLLQTNPKLLSAINLDNKIQTLVQDPKGEAILEQLYNGYYI